MYSIAECWQIFEQHLPEGGELPSGVDEKQFNIAEEVLGASLSSALREFFEAHNGTGKVYFYPFEIGNGEHVIHSLKDAVKHLQGNRESYTQPPFEPYGGPDWSPPPEVKPVCWHERWLPFTDNGCGDGMFIDFAPEPAGTMEQVVDWGHEGSVSNSSISFHCVEF